MAASSTTNSLFRYIVYWYISFQQADLPLHLCPVAATAQEPHDEHSMCSSCGPCARAIFVSHAPSSPASTSSIVIAAAATHHENHTTSTPCALKTWTLGCAEDLHISIGNLSFSMHVHILQDAPFRVLFGRPFYSLLLCRTADHPDGCVSITLHDPTDSAHIISINSQPRHSHQPPVAHLGARSVPSWYFGIHA
jgi:hypothetical protein